MGKKRIKITWPDLLGATCADGWVCIGRRGEATYTLIQQNGRPHTVLDYRQARRIRWEATPQNSAILAHALMRLVNAKLIKQGGVPCDRAMVCAQVKSTGREPTTLYLYEAGYRETIWPRYFWPLPGVPLEGGYAWPLWAAICAEMATKDLVAQVDNRRCGSVTEAVPHEE